MSKTESKRGGKRPGAGRPALNGSKTKRIAVRVTEAQHALLSTIANECMISVSYVVQSLIEKAIATGKLSAPPTD